MTALLLAGAVAFGLSLFGTWFLIEFLGVRRAHQPILAHDQRNAPKHQHKAGTPSLGGLAIVASAVLGYLVAHLRRRVYFTDTGLLVLGAIFLAGLVGFLDDWTKIRRGKNAGLSKRQKSIGLLCVGIGFALAIVAKTGAHTTLSFTRFDLPGWEIGKVGWVVLAVLLIQGSANGVNLTDGLDGLAAGSAALCFGAFTVIAFWGFRHPEQYAIAHALDLSIISVSMLGACAGFLWWNAAPAKIFMGDTGALAIGTALGALALTTNTQLLLPIIGLLYVMETLSVMAQITSYRYFNKRRSFRMAPILHHCELAGWPETTVISRFWSLSGMCTIFGW
ncbi:MAG: phospho-N-acetylmuramoyl-pentapeptide-transferase, partial [Acidimicrobiia bacterium]